MCGTTDLKTTAVMKLAAAAALLGKPDGQIAELLTERLLPLPGAERVTVKLSADAAAQARDATAKALYARVFEVLVMELNAGLAAGSGRTDATSVSVLDIFGFENFASNSLEQLLINYANGACVGLWRVLAQGRRDAVADNRLRARLALSLSAPARSPAPTRKIAGPVHQHVARSRASRVR